MYSRFYKKSIPLLLFVLFSCVVTVNAQQPGADSTERRKARISLIRNSSLGITQRSILVRDNVADSIIIPVAKGLIQNFLSGLTVGGYYRGLFYSRNMYEQYGAVGAKRVATVGDGYYDPTLFLYVGGNPTPNTSFGTEIIVANPFELYRGPAPGSNANGLVNPYYTAVLRGNTNTRIGNFSIIAGGIEWTRLTPFTFGANVGYNRYSIFERRPWDPVGNIKSRYAGYYYNGNINQDTRWGTQAFKGFMINGFLKDINTSVDIFYGRSAPNGGIDREAVVRPTQNYAVRIKKNLKNDNYVGLNTFNSINRSDSINGSNDIQWNIYTTEFSFRTKQGIILNGEVGAGRYVSPTYPESWSEAVLLDLSIPKKYTLIPLDFRYYQIGKSFTSNVANFNNTSIQQVTSGPFGKGNPVGTPFGPSMDNVGDMANNRRGGAINTTFKISKLVVSLGTQISAEMERLDQNRYLFYNHRINNLVWSRLPGVFPVAGGSLGPNERVGTFYRGAYERVKQSDTTADGKAMYRHFFNAMDLQLKYKARLFNRDLYINYLGSFNSVQNQFSAVTKFNNDAYIRAQFHEIDIYYQLHKSFILTLYGGLERIKGNQSTDIGSNGLPRDQTGKAIGVGFDFSISAATTLFFRQRWFSFDDKNFAGEQFSGNEGSVELKIYF